MTLCSLQLFLIRVLQFYPHVPLLGGGTTPCSMLEAKVKQKQSRGRIILNFFAEICTLDVVLTRSAGNSHCKSWAKFNSQFQIGKEKILHQIRRKLFTVRFHFLSFKFKICLFSNFRTWHIHYKSEIISQLQFHKIYSHIIKCTAFYKD